MGLRAVCVALGVAAIASGALAHSGATGIVKERMDGMTALATSMKSLVGMSKSGEINLANVVEAAKVIQSHSGDAMTTRFPEGSLPKVSEATPAIWTDWDRFSKIAQDLHDAASLMEDAAASDTFDLERYVTLIGDTCSACHKDFRIKK